jgi:hypothetical protein
MDWYEAVFVLLAGCDAALPAVALCLTVSKRSCTHTAR